MHLEIDRHWEKGSLLHRLEGRLRMVAALVWAVALLALRTPAGAGAGFALCVGLVLLARIPVRDIALRLRGVALILSPLLAIFPLAAEPGTKAEELGRAAAILLKGCSLVLLTFVVFNTARFTVTLGTLRKLGIPARLLSIFLLAHRALFILFEDRRRMELSALTRGWEGGTGRRAFALAAAHVGSLLVRSVDRTERLWHAMRTRGFSGEFPLPGKSPIGRGDVAVFCALVLIPVALVIAERMPWIS